MNPGLWLAPLHGVTNHVFRNAFARHFTGIDAYMAPFVSAIHADNATPAGKRSHFKDLLPPVNGNVTLVPQLLGNDSAAFVQTARTLSEYGYGEVNWNLGCPFPMVTNKKRGSGLLPYPDAIARFLEDACENSGMAISVKVRLGYDDPGQLKTLMPVFNRFPLGKIIIHPRIGTQMYEGNVDLDAFGEAAALSEHPITYNGDLKSVSVLGQLQAKFPRISEWMIGRWAVRNPFLPSLLKGGTLPAEPLAVIKAFHDDIYSGYREILSGQKHVLDKMKEIWTYLGESVIDGRKSLKAISKAGDLSEFDRASGTVFENATWTG